MLAEDALASTGSGDNMMRAIGTGKIPAGAVTVSLGTSGMICAFSEQPVLTREAKSPASATAPTTGCLRAER